jgi:hypothetical protein
MEELTEGGEIRGVGLFEGEGVSKNVLKLIVVVAACFFEYT